MEKAQNSEQIEATQLEGKNHLFPSGGIICKLFMTNCFKPVQTITRKKNDQIVLK